MSYNVPVRLLQQGSVEQIGASGTLLVSSGGSIQVAAGAALNVADAAGVSFPAGITLGGTAGRWAFGTVGLASGVGTIATGLTTVVSAGGFSVSGVQGGAGSLSSVVVDNSLFSSGSVIFRGLAGTLAFTGNNGTINWLAFGV